MSLRSLSAFLLSLALASPATAVAQDAPELVVTAIPWVSVNPGIPHVGLNGVSNTLKAIIEGGDPAACGGNYTYRWDLNGDGDFDDAGEGQAGASSGGQYGGYFAPVEAQVTFPQSEGDRLWLPRIRAWCGEEQATAVYPVLQRVDRVCGWGGDRGHGRLAYQCAGDQSERLTRSALADKAIDDGLWHMFKGFTHSTDTVDGEPVHWCKITDGGNNWFTSGQAVLAAMRRGHNYNEARDDNPYFRHFSQCGLHYILRSLERQDISARDGHSADSDQDGYGLKISAAGRGHVSYQAGTIYEPMAFFGNPDYASPVGIAEVKGLTLTEIAQDGADFLVYGMSDYGGGGGCEEFPLSGAKKWGWEYDPHGTQHIDHSTNGWPSEALRILARKLGTDTYEFAKDRQRCFLKNTCGADGCQYNSRQVQLAGNGLTSFGWVYDQTFDPDRAEMAGTLQCLTNNFDSFYGSAYNMYATTKGLRAFSPEIDRLGARDWHADFVDYLVNQQQGNGGWTVDTGAWISNGAGWYAVTGQYVQILQTWLEAFAYARAEPQLVGPGFPVQLRHDWSYILDPEVDIVRYRWSVRDDLDAEDANGNGIVDLEEVTWEYETEDPDEVIEHVYDVDIGFDELRDFRVILQVEDSQGRTNIDQDRVQVQVSKVNHAPVIRVSYPEGREWYRGHAGTTHRLDVSESFDPDADQAPFPGDDPALDDCEVDVDCRPAGVADRVTRYAWDLDFDGEFDDAEGPGVDFEIPDGVFEDGERFAVRVQVCDDGQWNGQCYDEVQEVEDGDPVVVVDCSVCAVADVVLELVGLTPPEASFEGLPEAPTEQGEVVTLDASGSSDPDDVGIVSYDWDLDGDGEYDDAQGETIDFACELPPGVHEIGVKITDAGGQTTELRREIVIVNQPPVVEAFAAVGEVFGQGDPFQVSLVATDPGGDALDVAVTYASPEGEGPWEATMAEGGWWIPTASAGDYVVTATISDPYEATVSSEITVVVDNLPPTVTRVFTSGPVNEGQPVFFQAWGTDPGGDPLEWRFAVTAEGGMQETVAQLTEPTFVHTPHGSGDYQVSVTATDSGGASHALVEDFRVLNAPPTIRSVYDNGPVPAGTPVTLFVEAWDPSPGDAFALEYLFDLDGDGAHEVTHDRPTLTWTFDTAGDHQVGVVVSDGEDTAGVIHTVHIDEPAKRRLSPELVIEGEGEAILFKVAQLVEDAPETDDWQWSFGDGAVGEGAEVTHTYADDGTYVVEVSAAGEVLGKATAVITNQAPMFLSLPPRDVRLGVMWEYAPKLHDPGAGDSLSLTVEGGPSAMQVSASEDGVFKIQWAPSEADAGTHHVRILATDDDGGVGTQEFDLRLAASDSDETFDGSTVKSGCATGGAAGGGGGAGWLWLALGWILVRGGRRA